MNEFYIVARADQYYIGNDGVVYPAPEILEWLLANLGKRGVFSSKHGWKGKWTMDRRSDNRRTFTFFNSSHALMFKLAWGGK